MICQKKSATPAKTCQEKSATHLKTHQEKHATRSTFGRVACFFLICFGWSITFFLTSQKRFFPDNYFEKWAKLGEKRQIQGRK